MTPEQFEAAMHWHVIVLLVQIGVSAIPLLLLWRPFR